MRRLALLILVAACAASIGWYVWDQSPSVIEQRMLDKSAAFIGAIQTGDRLAVLQLTVSEQEELEDRQDAQVVASGEIKVEPGLSGGETVGSFWAPSTLEQIRSTFHAPTSVSLNTDPDTPSLMLNFDCSGAKAKCLEHLKIFFNARARKIKSYITFWNEPSWQKLWADYYSKGLETKACDDDCPF